MLVWIKALASRTRASLSRRQVDHEFDQELRTHLEMLTEQNIQRGMRRTKQAARLAFGLGGVTQLKETNRELRGLPFLETFWQDIRYALRMLHKNPGFAAIAIFALALGIGANTAIFSAAYGILLKQLPYPGASRLIEFRADQSGPAPFRTKYLSDPEMDAITTQCDALEQTGGSSQVLVTLTGAGEPESLTGMQVFGDFFSVYEVPPILGRAIQPGDSQAGHNQVAVLSYDLWQTHFGGDAGAIGKQITLTALPAVMFLDHSLQGKLYTVVGVMPPRSRFPLDGDVWIPWVRTVNATYTDMMGNSQRKLRYMSGVARLKPNAQLDQANSELHTIASRMAAAYPATDKDWDVSAVSLRDAVAENYSTGLLLLVGAVSFVLLLACVSVSSLLIARSWSRQTEVAIREALGATRWRLIRQLLSESVLLALIGGVFGFLLAFWGVHLLRVIAPPGTPRLNDVGLNWPVLAYTMGISLVAGILFGLAPALQLTKPELNMSLKEVGAGKFGTIFSRRPHRLRSLLVVSEIALAFVLVTGSTLAVRSFEKLIHVDLGYRVDHVLTMVVKLSSATCPKFDACGTALNEVLERTRALPGVESVAISSGRPFSLIFTTAGFEAEGESPSAGSADSGTIFEIVTPDYFRTLGIPFLAGRSLTGADTTIHPLSP